MSIIYDALKKTQRNLRIQHRISWIDIFLCSIISILFTMMVIGYYPKIKNIFFKKNVTHSVVHPITMKKTLGKSIATEGKLININLTGVFISESEKVALLNAKPYHIGDQIDGKKIVSIEYDKVKLQEGDRTFVLQTVS